MLERQKLHQVKLKIIEIKTEINRLAAEKEDLNNKLMYLHCRKGALEVLVKGGIKNEQKNISG